MNAMTDEKEEFIEAVENDEYAEITLSTGDTLVTDWEGDGVFNPYAVPDQNPSLEKKNKHYEEREVDVAEAIEEAFDVYVDEVEYDPNADLFYIFMDKPE